MKKFLSKFVKQGLLKIVEPSKNISLSYQEKSKSNFESAIILLENKKLEESVSFVYYSMYNLILSLLYSIGIKSENHIVSIFLLKNIFGLDNSKIIEAKSERIDKQYYVGFRISKEEVKNALKMAEEFNRELKGFISGIGRKDVENYRNKFKELLR